MSTTTLKSVSYLGMSVLGPTDATTLLQAHQHDILRRSAASLSGSTVRSVSMTINNNGVEIRAQDMNLSVSRNCIQTWGVSQHNKKDFYVIARDETAETSSLHHLRVKKRAWRLSAACARHFTSTTHLSALEADLLPSQGEPQQLFRGYLISSFSSEEDSLDSELASALFAERALSFCSAPLRVLLARENSWWSAFGYPADKEDMRLPEVDHSRPLQHQHPSLVFSFPDPFLRRAMPVSKKVSRAILSRHLRHLGGQVQNGVFYILSFSREAKGDTFHNFLLYLPRSEMESVDAVCRHCLRKDIKLPDKALFQTPGRFHADEVKLRKGMRALTIIGKGQFGEVYLAAFAHSPAVHSPVAVKMLKENAAATDKRDFKREASLLPSLQHANVVRFADAAQSNMPWLLVLEFVRYGDLRRAAKILKEKNTLLREAEILCLSVQIARALEYLRSQRIVHMDVAARNCLLSQDNHVKLCDFGLARPLPDTEDSLVCSEQVGKMPIKWMPPEAIFKGVFSLESDVWAFGVVIWELFSGGVVPFSSIRGRDFETLLQQGGRLERPETCPPKVFETVCLPCWRADRTKRPNAKYLVHQLRVLASRAAAQEDIRDIGKMLMAALRGEVPDPAKPGTISILGKGWLSALLGEDVSDISELSGSQLQGDNGLNTSTENNAAPSDRQSSSEQQDATSTNPTDDTLDEGPGTGTAVRVFKLGPPRKPSSESDLAGEQRRASFQGSIQHEQTQSAAMSTHGHGRPARRATAPSRTAEARAQARSRAQSTVGSLKVPFRALSLTKHPSQEQQSQSRAGHVEHDDTASNLSNDTQHRPSAGYRRSASAPTTPVAAHSGGKILAILEDTADEAEVGYREEEESSC